MRELKWNANRQADGQTAFQLHKLNYIDRSWGSSMPVLKNSFARKLGNLALLLLVAVVVNLLSLLVPPI